MVIFSDTVRQSLQDRNTNNQASVQATENLPLLVLICRALYKFQMNHLLPLLQITPLTTQAEKEFIELLILIIEQFNPIIPKSMISSDYGFYSIFLACKYNNLAFLEQVRNVAPEWLSARTHFASTDKTILMWAAQHNEIWFANWLIQANKACINSTDRLGFNAFMLATHCGHINTMQLLAEAGANLRARSYDGRSAFLVAASAGQLPAMQWLLNIHIDFIYEQDINGANAYILAAKYGSSSNHINIINFLRRIHGESINIEDANGNNALANALLARQQVMSSWLYTLEVRMHSDSVHLRVPFDLCHALPPNCIMPIKLRIAHELFSAIQGHNWDNIRCLLPKLDSDYLVITGHSQKTIIQHLNELASKSPIGSEIEILLGQLKKKAYRKTYCLDQLEKPIPIVYPEKFFKVRHTTPAAPYLSTHYLKKGC